MPADGTTLIVIEYNEISYDPRSLLAYLAGEGSAHRSRRADWLGQQTVVTNMA